MKDRMVVGSRVRPVSRAAESGRLPEEESANRGRNSALDARAHSNSTPSNATRRLRHQRVPPISEPHATASARRRCSACASRCPLFAPSSPPLRGADSARNAMRRQHPILRRPAYSHPPSRAIGVANVSRQHPCANTTRSVWSEWDLVQAKASGSSTPTPTEGRPPRPPNDMLRTLLPQPYGDGVLRLRFHNRPGLATRVVSAATTNSTPVQLMVTACVPLSFLLSNAPSG